MAVKERKQITGTTAQIQAYKGHEGQIVWDKEKKTFVGMSGTAGKNYPLAPQAYVDNEVSKVNAEVAKKASSAELTQGLAGKEDKGTCLPLTGGKLTDTLWLKNDGRLYQDQTTSSGYGYVILSTEGQGDYPGSCCLFLSNSDSIDSGTIILRHNCLDGVRKELVLDSKNDQLYWCSSPVETVYSSGANYIRYKEGLQIVFDRVGIPSSGYKLYNYPVPFVGGVAVAVSQNQSVVINSVNWSSSTQCELYSSWSSNENNLCPIVVIGRWK